MPTSTYTVTTITELVNKVANLYNSEYTVVINVEPDNDDKLLDFNNEDFYYRNDSFLKFQNYAANNNAFLTIDFKGSTLTNIYVYPGKAFFYMNDDGITAGRTYIFKNGTFEMVLNKAYAIYNYHANSNYSNINYGYTTFKNCVFNLKVNGSNPKNSIFFLPSRKVEFINCVFNIDIVNCSGDSLIGVYGGQGSGDNTSDANVYIYSCEFRYRLGDKTSLNTYLVNFNKRSPTLYNINDNIVFFDYYFPFESGDAKATIKHIYSNYGWNLNANSSYSNNFFASLDTGKEIAIKLNQGDGKLVNGTTFFCDGEKIEGAAFPGTTCVSLSTAQCKDAAALAAAGYVCAIEG